MLIGYITVVLIKIGIRTYHIDVWSVESVVVIIEWYNTLANAIKAITY